MRRNGQQRGAGEEHKEREEGGAVAGQTKSK